MVVSEEGMLSHARVNSKRVSGAAEGARVAAGTGAGSLSRSATGTSRVLNTVSFPDMRKIPPPTRPTDFASRACLASLKDEGVGFGAAGAGVGAGAGAIKANFPSGGGGGVEEGWRTRRELIGFKRRSSSPPVRWVMMGGRLSSSSTIVIGTRRRFGGAVAEEDDAGGGVEVKTPVGADRCPTMRVRTVRKGVWNAAKANRRAYCLSLPVHNKFVDARELGLDSFVVRLEFECPLKIYRRTTPQDDDNSNIKRGTVDCRYVPLWASPSFWRAARAWALRKNAFTFLLLERPSTVVQSRSASSFLRCSEMRKSDDCSKVCGRLTLII